MSRPRTTRIRRRISGARKAFRRDSNTGSRRRRRTRSRPRRLPALGGLGLRRRRRRRGGLAAAAAASASRRASAVGVRRLGVHGSAFRPAPRARRRSSRRVADGASASASALGRLGARPRLGSALARGRRLGRGLGLGGLGVSARASGPSALSVASWPPRDSFGRSLLAGSRPIALSGAVGTSSTLTVPPAASIFARAEAVNPSATTNSGADSSPSPRILSGLSRLRTSPTARRMSWLTVIWAGALVLPVGLASAASASNAPRSAAAPMAPDVHDLVLDLEAVLEAAELRDAHVERRLATLEPRRDRAAGARLLALRAAARGLALAGGDAAADARALLARPFGRAQVVESHAFLLAFASLERARLERPGRFERRRRSAISSTVTRKRT